MNDVFEKIDLNSVDWKSSREFFDSLVDELQKLDNKDESYNFTWVGKRKSIIEAGRPIEKILRPDVEASKDFDKTKNMLIVGDNLDALKLLQESYLGKIKMIYIDPPYNTGHDFVYHDNFTIKKADFEDGSTDSDGNVVVSEDEFAENSKTNGRFHSDWLSMMYPRLKLARNLLTDDGVIFISIDDNEYANLKKICDEIFGEDSYIMTFTWKTRQASGKQVSINNTSREHEYLLCYGKTETVKFNGVARDRGGYSNPDNDPRGDWAKHPLDIGSTSTERPNCYYDLIDPKTGIIYHANPNRVWAFSKESMQRLLDEGKILFHPEGKTRPYLKKFWTELKSESKPISSWLSQDSCNIGYNTEGTKCVNDIFNNVKLFDYPKPISLIRIILEQVTSSKDNDIILDFFTGSGTTGHAVMNLNSNDDGNRRYILVQLDEEASKKSDARKAGYDTIDQITAERLRRAGEKIRSEHPDADIDTGFRVFRVDGSNENEDIRKPLNQIGQSDLFSAIDNIKKDRTPLDLLFGVIYASALPFDLKLETRKIGENTVYLYGYLDEGTGLVACFDDNISEETFKEIAKLKALTAAFKDSSFTGSAAKINLSEHFRIISPDTKVKVL